MVPFKHKVQFCYLYFHIISPVVPSPFVSSGSTVQRSVSSVINPNILSSISNVKSLLSFPESETVKKIQLSCLVKNILKHLCQEIPILKVRIANSHMKIYETNNIGKPSAVFRKLIMPQWLI